MLSRTINDLRPFGSIALTLQSSNSHAVKLRFVVVSSIKIVHFTNLQQSYLRKTGRPRKSSETP